VGSAFGYGIWSARHFGHPVLAFECRNDEYERLRIQFENDTQVRLVNACVSDRPGLTALHRAGDSSSLLPAAVARGPEALKARSDRISFNASGIETVRMVTLDGLLSDGPDGMPDISGLPVGIIAVDVQGAEPMVLRGAAATIRSHQPYVMYEDTMVSGAVRRGKLLRAILGVEGPVYDCKCDRDCTCIPSGPNSTHSSEA